MAASGTTRRKQVRIVTVPPDSEAFLKPRLAGLVDRQGGTHIGGSNPYTSSNGDLRADANGQFTNGVQARTLAKAVTLNLDWATIEPTKRNNWALAGLDNALAEAAAAGQTEYGLRMYAGRYTPAWVLLANSNALAIPHHYGDQNTPSRTHFGTAAQSADTAWTGNTGSNAFTNPGTQIDYFATPEAGTSGAMPKIWDPRWPEHYYRAMSRLARYIESDDRIRQVQMTMMSTFFGEPMLHQRQAQNTAGDKMNYTNWRAAGWTEEAEMDNWRAMFEIHDACFSRTRSWLPVSVADSYIDTADDTYRNALDPQLTRELMRLAQSILGAKLVIGQNSLQIPRQQTTAGNGVGNTDWLETGLSRYQVVWDEILHGYPVFGFQTQPMSSIGTTPYTANTDAALLAALDDGIGVGAQFIELPTGYTDYMSSSEWSTRDAQLRVNRGRMSATRLPSTEAAVSADEVAFSPAAGLVSTETQAAIEEAVGVAADDLAAHEAASTAHTAAQVSVDPTGLAHITATDVENALAQLDGAVGYVVVSGADTNRTAVAGSLYEYTLTNARTLTTPASPTDGQEFVAGIASNTATYKLTLAPNSGQTLEVNGGTNLVIGRTGEFWVLRWDSTGSVWRVRPFTSAGPRVNVLVDTGTPAPDASFPLNYLTSYGAATGFAAPVGTSVTGDLFLRVKATSSRAIAWNSIYRSLAASVPLPANTTGGGAIDFFWFKWNAVDSKWDLILAIPGAGGAALDAEAVQDIVGAFVAAGTGIVITYDDAGNALSLAVDTSTIATRSYVDSAVVGLFDPKGSIDASANPNYPAALKGDAYLVSVAGKVGGASGKSVDVDELLIAFADNAGGTEASVGSAWHAFEHNIVGAYVAGGTDVAIADGGTGASTASAGFNALAQVTSTTFGRALNALADAVAMRAAAGLVIGTDVQAAAANLAALAGLTGAADRVPYFTAAGTMALATFTSLGRALAGSADAAAAKTTLGVSALFGDFGGLVGFGHSYTQLGGNGPTIANAFDTWTNFMHRIGAALNIATDETYLYGCSGAQLMSPTAGDTTDAQGIGVILKHLYPNHAYVPGATRPTGRSFPALFVLDYGYNDVLRNVSQNSNLAPTTFAHALRTAIARIRAAMVYDSRASQITYTGFATTTASPYPAGTSGIVPTGSAPDNLACTGPSWRISKANNDKATFTIPNDWPGGGVAMTLIAPPGTRCLLSTALTGTGSTTVVLKGSILGDAGYKVLAAGDRIYIDPGAGTQEAITLGSTADGGVTWTGCTRNADGGAATGNHSVNAAVILPTDTAKVTWGDSTATGASGHADTFLAGLGASSDGSYSDIGTSHRCGIPVTVRFTIPASDAGLTIVAKTSGIVGNEYIGFDHGSLEDPEPPPVAVLNQPDMGGTMAGGGSFYANAVATALNGAIASVVAEFDQAVKVVDVATELTELYKATVQTVISSTGTVTLKVTPVSAARNLFSGGRRIRVLGASGVETMRITAVDKTNAGANDGTWACTVVRNDDGAGAQSTIAVGKTVMGTQWVNSDWIHPSDFGHDIYAAKALDTLATVTQTTRQIANAGGLVGRRQPRVMDGGYLGGECASRTTQSSAVAGGIGALHLHPVYVPEPVIVTAMSAEVTGATNASGTLRYGIWTDTKYGPGFLLLDSIAAGGTTPTQGATTSRASTGLWLPLKPGWYWFGVALQGTGTMATMRAINGLSGAYPAQNMVAGSIAEPVGAGPFCGYKASGVTGALASLTQSQLTADQNIVMAYAKVSVPIRD